MCGLGNVDGSETTSNHHKAKATLRYSVPRRVDPTDLVEISQLAQFRNERRKWRAARSLQTRHVFDEH
jgi:nucleoid DNA-binding protein